MSGNSICALVSVALRGMPAYLGQCEHLAGGVTLRGLGGRTATMFLAMAILAGGVAAQPPFGGILSGGLIRLESLLQNPDVRKELGLSPQQLTKISELIRAIRDKHIPELDKLRSQGPEGRDTMIALMKTISEQTIKELDGVLKPEQLKRLKQIRYQAQGFYALSEPEVQRRLALTADEMAKIKSLSEEMTDQIGEILKNSQLNSQESLRRIVEVRKETMMKALAALNDEQRVTWRELIGTPFDLKFMATLDRRSGSDRRSPTKQ